MPRRETRARKRRARFDDLCSEFYRSHRDPVVFWALLRRIADSNTRVWAIANAVNARHPLDEDELAMVAQAAAPQLVRMMPGTSRRSIADKEREWLQESLP